MELPDVRGGLDGEHPGLNALTACSGAIGDAALRHALNGTENAAAAAPVVKADVAAGQRPAADAAVRTGARRTSGGLPVTVRTLVRSGPTPCPVPSSRRTPPVPGRPDDSEGAWADRLEISGR